jgi:alpha-tubulin suppressor-like RCC1 family protein
VAVTVGSSGGSVAGPGGVNLVIPAAALPAPTLVRIADSDAGAPPLPPLPPGITVARPMLELTPHGTEFGVPALLSLPSGEIPTGSTVLLLKTNAARDGWEQLQVEVVNGRVQAPITRFSNVSYMLCTCGRATAPPPTIAMPPRGGTVNEGGYVLLSVDAIGAAPFTYQWLRNGRAIPGETARAIVINPVTMAEDNMRLSVTVTDTFGQSATSVEARVRVRPAPPVVSSAPLDVVAHVGSIARFVAATTSSVEQTLQWERSNDAGATWGAAPSQDARLQVPNVQITPDNGALFRLVATNPGGSVTTRAARLTVIPAPVAPAIVSSPAAAEVLQGRSVSFSVVASGGELSYQWQRAELTGPFMPIAGAPDAATFTLSNATLADDGARVRAVVSNALGTAVSAGATLRVIASISAPVARLAGGDSHTLALRADGQLIAWGLNGSGQLGVGSATDRAPPTPVPGLTDIATFASGARHGLALRSNGQMVAWGDNRAGQLGDGTTIMRTTPVSVGPAPLRHVAAAESISLALDSSLGLLTWGTGFLGNGGAMSSSQVPQTRNSPGFVRLAAGAQFQAALRSDGTLWTWGINDLGQLGTGDLAARLEPTPVAAPAGLVAVVAGQAHVLALAFDGAVYAFGDGRAGQLGLDAVTQATTATRVALPAPALAVAAGQAHSLALLIDGRVYAWGSNNSGQLGSGNALDSRTPVRVDAGWTMPVQSLGAGRAHSLVLDAEGRVWSWGDNAWGQLGDGSQTPRDRPVVVPGLRLD